MSPRPCARGTVAPRDKDTAIAIDDETPRPGAWLGAALHTVLGAWRHITWRQVQATFWLGCALFVVLIAIGLALFAGASGLLLAACGSQIRAFAVLLTFVVADRVTAGDPMRRAPYVWAVLVGAPLGMALTVVFMQAAGRVLIPDWDVDGTFGFYAYMTFDMVLIAGATVWVILDRRRNAFARERMLAAELDRIAAARRSLESDLQAMQARVEPQFLFNTLAQVRDLYRMDAAHGERMLDELIAYLRAAMPRMRDTASTLGQELELARAYLAIVKVRLGDRLSVAIEMPSNASNARMPPMMLLPLVDRAVRAADAADVWSITLRAAVADATIRLSVICSAGTLAAARDDADIAGIRERLAALYGEQATLALRGRGDGSSEAVLALPLEQAAADVAAAAA